MRHLFWSTFEIKKSIFGSRKVFDLDLISNQRKLENQLKLNLHKPTAALEAKNESKYSSFLTFEQISFLLRRKTFSFISKTLGVGEKFFLLPLVEIVWVQVDITIWHRFEAIFVWRNVSKRHLMTFLKFYLKIFLQNKFILNYYITAN